MILAETWENARTRRSPLNHRDFDGYRMDYFHSDVDARPAPQALFVELTPGWVLRTHFHLQHQFQVVTGGSGRLGRRELRPFGIHYASPESGYGPIVAGEDGLSYLALRAVTEHGGYFLPEARSQMRSGLRKRELSVPAPALSNAEAMQARRELQVEPMIEPQAGGLAAWFMRVPTGATTLAPAHAESGGRFHVVAGGSMRVGDEEKPKFATVWTSHDEPPLPVIAGARGLELLVLQFPLEALAT